MQPATFMWTTHIATYVACIHICSVIVHIAIGIHIHSVIVHIAIGIHICSVIVHIAIGITYVVM